MKSEFHNRLSLSRQTGGGCPLPPHPYEETIKAIIGTTTTLNTGINLLEGKFVYFQFYVVRTSRAIF